jgi:signal peptidase II
MSNWSGLRLGLPLAALIVVLDQLSKWWIVEVVMQPPRVIPVLPFFNIVMGWNRGVSFGLFNEKSVLSQWFLPVLALVIVAALVVWLYRSEHRYTAVALGLVIGGALGNVIDRLHYGAVADFLDVHAFGYHWPAFNVADSAITVGAVMLVLESLFGGAEKNNNKKAAKRTGGG